MSISAGDVIVKIGGETGGFDRSMDHADARIKKSSGQWQQRMKKVGMAIMGTVIAIGGVSLKMAADFDSAMREVNTMLLLNEEEFQALSADVRQLSKDMGVDAVASAEALYQAISAGVPKENVITFLEIATKAAIAGVTDTTVAVDGLTTVINAYKLPMSEAQKISDVMFTTVKRGKTTFPELAASMSLAMPTAAALGVSYEEVLATVATLTKQGVPTAQAFTQIRASMVSLLKPTKEMEELIAAAGYETGRTMLEALGYAGTLDALTVAAQGNDAILAKAFGSVEALGVVYGTTGENALMAAEDIDAMTNSAGAADAAFDEMEKTVSRKFAKVKAQFKDTALTLGTALIPVIARLLEIITPVIAKVSEWIEKHPRLSVVILASVGAMGAMMIVIGPLMKMWGVMLGLIHSNTLALVAHKVVMIAHKLVSLVAIGVMKLITIAQWAWNAAMNANPIGVIITLIGLLVAAGIYLYKNWDKVVAFFKNAWRRIKLFFLTGVEKVLGILARFTGWIPFVGDKIAALHDKIANMIDAEKLGSDADRAAASLAELAKKVGEASDDMVADVEQATQSAIQSAQTVANEEKRILEERASFYRDKHYERMELIDERMMAEIRAIDPALAAELEGYNEQIKALGKADEERNRQIEEDRVKALEEELKVGEDLTAAREREIKDQIADSEARWETERLIEERNLKISELNMDDYFEGRKGLIDAGLAAQTLAYDMELAAFKALNTAKLEDAERFVKDYNEIMAGLGAERAYEFELPGQPTRGGAPPPGYASWDVYDQIKKTWQASGKSWEAFIKGRGMAGTPIPTLQGGGLVTRPTLAMLGERFRPELVLPLDKLGAIGGNIFNYNVSFPGLVVREELDIEKISRAVGRELRIIQDRTERRVGLRGG